MNDNTQNEVDKMKAEATKINSGVSKKLSELELEVNKCSDALYLAARDFDYELSISVFCMKIEAFTILAIDMKDERVLFLLKNHLELMNRILKGKL